MQEKISFLVDRMRRHVEADAKVNDFDDVELAAAVLLVNAAKADGRISEPERQSVLGGLRIKFGLQEQDAKSLMSAAEQHSARDASLYGVAKTLENGMSQRQREELMALVRDVVFSDGSLDPLEMAVLNQMARMLNVANENPAAVRQRVMAALGLSQEMVRRRHRNEHTHDPQSGHAAQQQLENINQFAKKGPPSAAAVLTPFGTGSASDDS